VVGEAHLYSSARAKRATCGAGRWAGGRAHLCSATVSLGRCRRSLWSFPQASTDLHRMPSTFEATVSQHPASDARFFLLDIYDGVPLACAPTFIQRTWATARLILGMRSLSGTNRSAGVGEAVTPVSETRAFAPAATTDDWRQCLSRTVAQKPSFDLGRCTPRLVEDLQPIIVRSARRSHVQPQETR
jgi:hypothetical protein